LEEVVRRHEALRTTFSASARGPVSRVLASQPVPLPVVALDGLAAAAAAAEVQRLLAVEAMGAFDLVRGPLLRTTLLRLGAREHVLTAVMHHIVTDGWSMGVLQREVGLLYGALSRGGGSPLPELPIQYADFASWQRQWLQGEVLARQLAYWRERLAGAPRRLELPADRPRPAAPSPRGSALPVALDPSQSRQLAAFSRRHGATPYMTLLAAFGVLLSRSANQEDLLVGTPVANRTWREIEGLIGFFVNTLVLRVDLRGAPTFLELLGRVREMALGAFTHQDLPFERLADELAPERDPRQSPLFQVMFAFQSAGRESLELPGVKTLPIEIAAQTAKFDLTFALSATEAGIGGAVEFSSDLFDAATIERHIARFTTLVEAIIADADRGVADLPLLAPGERAQLLAWGGARASYPAGETLAALFAARVRRSPDARALTCDGRHMTYAELNRWANRLAWHLRKLGVGPREPVCLGVERSLELVVAMLGIVKAGGAYVPLDPSYPRERRAFLAADCGARVLVGTREALAGLPHAERAVVLDGLDLSPYPASDPPALGDGQSLAYVIYTSGSTGRPKGVPIAHDNVVRLFRATEPWFGFGATDVWTMFHSYAFDFSIWEIWGALLYGGRLVVVPHAVSRTPEAFHDLLEAEGVTVLSQTPSAFAQLARADEEPRRAGSLAALRLVIFGGEALEASRLAPWFERRGDERPRLVNMYGITETTVHVTCRPLRTPDAQARSGSVIGVPLPDVAIYVLDPAGQLAPPGIPGELAIGGAGLAHGYLGRPELTAERFTPDPVSAEPGARLYRSGDLGRLLAGGELAYLGRIDHQVKIRGFRIELGEIEAALAEQAGVREAIVLAREEAGGERRLVAFVVPQPQAALAGDELRKRLSRKLPEPMVPAAFVLLEALPLTANGKVDRQALLALPTFQRDEATVYAMPTNQSEAALVEIFEQVLGVEQVGIDDRFFSLGGDSILSLRVRALADRRGLHFALRTLLEHQTVRGLASHLEPAANWVPTGRFALLSPRDRAALPPGLEDAYPLTALQAGMLFHSGYTADSALYHNVSSLRLAGRFSAAAFHGAVEELLARHPVLRTSFDASRYSEPLQLVHRQVAAPLTAVDLRGLPPERQERELEAAFAAEKRERLDWEVAPLLRFRVHLLGEQRFQFTWTEHHAILDGWSLASMLAELFELYRLALRLGQHGKSLLRPPPAAAFRDFVALERRTLAEEAGRRYWLERLEGAPRTALTGAATPGPPRMRSTVRLLTPELTAQLRQLARSAGMPLKSVLLAAHFRLLALTTGESDLVSGLVTNGRLEVEGGERILGLFLNTVPLRLRLAGGSWLELIQAVFAAEQSLTPFRTFPMAELQRLLGGGPLFASAFNFVHFHVLQGLASDEIQVLGERTFAQTNLPLTASFTLFADRSRLHLTLEFDEALYARGQVEAIAQRYQAVLAELAARPEARCDAEGLLAEAERQLLLREWNDTRTPSPDATLDALVGRAAAAQPETVAVIAAGRCLSYGELCRRARQLAGRLRALGVGPEVPVGLLLERSPELIVSLLGILDAGGAYVPLDPGSPALRLGQILDDAGLRVVVTDSHLAGRLADRQLETVLVDRREQLALRGAPGAARGATAASLAYILYTSGSTGRPKGVMVPHRGVVNYLAWCIAPYGLGPGRRSLLHSSIGFDLTVTSLWGPLIAGGEVHLLAEGEGWEGMAAALALTPVQMLKLTPSHLKVLNGELPPEAMRQVDVLILGGEALAGDVLDSWRTAAPATRVVNEYGPTEATVACSVQLAPAATIGTGPVPIGRPIANASLYVLSAAETALLPQGAQGEIAIGGDGLARGYLGRPDLTAERFLPDPFAEAPGGRLYRTGDRGRRLPAGPLEYLGRTDLQVKVRGVRVELGEIESALLRHPGLRETVVVAREDLVGGTALVAYLVAASVPPPSVGELLPFLRQWLPSALLPADFVFVDALPLTANGKLDRRALPAPGRLRPELAQRYLPPRDALELDLVRLWEGVLKVRPVGITDDFFALGGHSLLAVQLMARIERGLGSRLPIAILLRHPTVERLAAAVRGQVGPVRRRALVEVEPGSGRPFFCVHPIGGDVLSYVHLARHLAKERAFYGLQVFDHEEGAAPQSLEQMAAQYIEAVRQVQPAGPYSLGGWSMGGVVAFEMARQLAAAGERVDLVALIDSLAPAEARQDGLAGGTLVALFAADLARLLHLDGFALPPGFGELATAAALDWLASNAERLNLLPAGMERAEVARRFATFAANHQRLASYHGGPSAAPLVLFRAAERPDGLALAADLGWG
ncbi:MAG TPA: amino acid adenylation domain-containing protein, partial [Thermoanaerobaculia bacterium]|nr:amino acid adenylation domain-containing protein [Thermoanaerobaculia bacterium]